MRAAGPWLAAAALAVAAFVLAGRLTASPAGGIPAGGDVADAMFSGGRMLLSDGLYRQADLYFHRGVGDVRKREAHGLVFEGLARRVAPRSHVHREGADVREIMPWLRLATRANPHNVTAFLVAAYWADTEAGQPDAADQILREASLRNPMDYRVPLEQSRMLLRRGRRDQARQALDQAFARWPNGQVDADQAGLDRAELLLLRGLNTAADGKAAEARRDLEELLSAYPDRRGVRDMLEELARAPDPKAPAIRILQVMMRKREHVCDRGEAEGDVGHDHEHEHEGATRVP